MTRDIEHLQTYLPLPQLPTIPNHPFAFLLRKKAVDGKNLKNLMLFSGSPNPPTPRAVEYSLSLKTILLEVCVLKLIVSAFCRCLEWKSKHLILPLANQESLFSVMRLSRGRSITYSKYGV